MSGRLVVVSGTGTGIGKTHLTCALVRGAGGLGPVLGFKPIESGATGDRGPDGEALLLASHRTFHVKPLPAPYVLPRPVSPHLAARGIGAPIRLPPVLDAVSRARELAPLVFVELAGGLFTPLAPGLTNAELVLALAPEVLVLVAPDRLGVLHDVGAVCRAAQGCGLAIAAVALVEPPHADLSTGTNAAELPLVCAVPVHPIPRATVEALACDEALRALLGICTGLVSPHP